MFDLFRSREKMVRIFLGGILVVVSLSMLTYLIPSYGGGSGSGDTIVAEVGKDVITLPELQLMVQNTMRGRQIPPEILPNFIPQYVDQLITDRALTYEAGRLGFQVTDADVADAIRQLVPNLFPDGKFVGKDTYAAFLAQQNITIADFEGDLKRQILITRLRDVAVEGTIVSPLEIETTYRKNNEKIKVQYVKVLADKFRAEAQPTAEELQAYFKANASTYQIPEKKNLVILIADQAKLQQSLNPTDADLQQMYNQNQSQFRTPERVKVRHILLKTTEKPASEEPKIKAQAEDLLKQIRGGANFADLAKKYSEDPGSGAKGGELDFLARGQTVPEFERVAFSLKPGQTSDLVKTQYGYHIIQVEQHEDARLRPFAEVKGELADQWKKQRVSDQMAAISDRAQTALQRDPGNPEKVAAQFNMQIIRADAAEPGKPLPEVGTNADFGQSIAALKKGEASQAVALPGDKIALALATDVIPGRPATFDEVQSQLRDKVTQSRLTAVVQNRAKQLVDQAKSMGGDLAKAAKAMGLEAKTTDDFVRSANIEGLGSASYFQDGFSQPDGSIIGPIGMPDATVVAKVVSHEAPDMSKLAEQRATIRDQIKSQKARDRNTLFETGVREQLIKDGKVKIHQDVINRFVSGYRAG